MKSTSHLVHWIHLVHLTLCWLSSSTLFVVLTLIDLVAPKSYLCKQTVIVHGPLERLLLRVTIPYRERKPTARLVKLFEGQFAWLMCSSKLQSYLEFCQFTQTFLKLELQNRKCAPSRISKGVPFMTIF
jgi:hypothetical protein